MWTFLVSSLVYYKSMFTCACFIWWQGKASISSIWWCYYFCHLYHITPCADSEKCLQFLAIYKANTYLFHLFRDVILYPLTAGTWHLKIYQTATLVYVKEFGLGTCNKMLNVVYISNTRLQFWNPILPQRKIVSTVWKHHHPNAASVSAE